MAKIGRRTFLGLSVSAGVATALPTVAFPAPAAIAKGANEKIRVGVIGCGWRGGDHLNAFNSITGVELAGFADPDSRILGATGEKYPKAKPYRDLRELLDNKEIDAVAIATCNHWHCLAAIWAMQAGKDVYVEKPLSHSMWEGRQVVLAARKYDRICQVGTQQRSDPMQAEIKKFLHEDKALGRIISCRVNRYGIRRSIGKRTTPLPIPPEVDYNLWLGPAEDKPLFREKFHYDWHWDWNTGSGEMGNWGVHVMDDMKNNILLDKISLPHRLMGGGARVVYNDAGETPNVHFVYFDTGIIPVVIGLSNVPAEPKSKSAGFYKGPGSGYIAWCEGGVFCGERGKATAYDSEGKVVKTFKGNSGRGHQRNFIDAVRAHDRSILNAEVELGNASSDWCNLANIAFRSGKPYEQKNADFVNGKTEGIWEKLMDDTTRLLKGNSLTLESGGFKLSPMLTLNEAQTGFSGPGADEANAFVKRTYRKGFEVEDFEK